MKNNATSSLSQHYPKMIKPEVLAPAGRWEALEAVVAAGADAVYLGGKKLNMRMWRSEFNFSDEELRQAVEYTHQRGVKLYVTLNNLYYEEDVPELQSYLQFLEEIKVDALIVQDLAVVALAQRIGLTRPLHASVQVNIHNLQTLQAFQEMGFSRAIVSKDLSLEEVYYLGQATGMELEYFVHGDLCIAHTGQCLTSALVFGESSNRGRCLKPCRWRYQIVQTNDGSPIEWSVPGPHVLASNDLCLYPYIPQLIQAGIISFKIEGRMREGSFLKPLVQAYREAVDRYWEDPQAYRLDQTVWNSLVNQRVRDYTTGQAFGLARPASIGFSGEREPHFPTRAITLPTLTKAELRERPNNLGVDKEPEKRPVTLPELSVRVGSQAALRAALTAGSRTVYVGGEVAGFNAPVWGHREVQEALKEAHSAKAKLVVLTPKITKRTEMQELARWFKELDQLQVDGVMVGNWGTGRLVKELTDLPVYGDTSLNLTNSLATDLALKIGIHQGTVPLELSADSLQSIMENTHLPLEVVSHGHLTAMILERCLPRVLKGTIDQPEICPRPCAETDLALMDECGQKYQVRVDQFCRTHLQFPYQLCLLPILPWLLQLRPCSLRIEGQHYEGPALARVVQLYRKYLELALNQPELYTVSLEDWKDLQKLNPDGYTLGALGV